MALIVEYLVIESFKSLKVDHQVISGTDPSTHVVSLTWGVLVCRGGTPTS